jgi:NDP-sugar pyrophosphorylase family protein
MGSVLLGKTNFPYGVVETADGLVTGFRQKPVLPYDICVGHYAFTGEAVERYFPERGGFEDKTLPRMAGDGVLHSLRLEGEWVTVNNLKQLEEARKKLNQTG